MYFGEFLLNKKIINEEQLLDALVYQVEHLPSFLRVLREEKTFSSKDIVRMIQVQLESNSDLITILKDEFKIDELGIHKLYQKQVSNRKMLGSVLVELKIVEQSVIEKMLHEFLRDKENFKKAKIEEIAKPLQAPAQKIEISEAALESLRELGLSDEDFVVSTSSVEKVQSDEITNPFVEEFLNVFSEKMHNKFLKLIGFLEQSSNDESNTINYFNTLYTDLYILKEAASLTNLSFSSHLFSTWGELVEQKMMLENEQLKNWIREVLPLLEKSLTYLWEIRALIVKDKSEDHIQSMPELKESYIEISDALRLLS